MTLFTNTNARSIVYVHLFGSFVRKWRRSMTGLATRQIALLTVFANCAMIITLAVASGLGADTREALTRAWPLAGVCALALTFLLADPFRSR